MRVSVCVCVCQARASLSPCVCLCPGAGDLRPARSLRQQELLPQDGAGGVRRHPQELERLGMCISSSRHSEVL